MQIGLPYEVSRWLMGCITSTNFGILVNGFTTHFFGNSRGIRKGCVLSPLFFLLVIEGLSILIDLAKKNKIIKGLKVSFSLYVSHLVLC